MLVFEDDVMYRPSFMQYWKLMNDEKCIPDKYHLLYLGGTGHLGGHRLVNKLINQHLGFCTTQRQTNRPY